MSCDFTIWQVHITSQNMHQIPFGVGMASDPMALRRGGKKLSMEDVCYYQWPLPGLDQVLDFIAPLNHSLFCVFVLHFLLEANPPICLTCSLDYLVFVMGMVEMRRPDLLAS